jgi:hypothetical protein
MVIAGGYENVIAGMRGVNSRLDRGEIRMMELMCVIIDRDGPRRRHAVFE